MITRINKLIIGLLLVVSVSYLFYLNSHTVTINLGPSWSLSAPGAIVFISTFIGGFLFCSMFALLFGLKSLWRERGLEERERRRNRSEKLLLDARGALAAEEWDRAKDLWTSIVNRDPENTIARIELSKSLEGAGKIREALKILDEARVADSNNTEVLFRAAELNLGMNNATAALDNLALIMNNHPNQRAASMARDLAESLNRFEDALQYHESLEKLGASGKEVAEARTRIEFKKVETEGAQDENKLKESLHKFAKRNSSFVPALHRLALLEADAGNNDEASRLLMSASKNSGEPIYWQEAAKIWLKSAQPAKAVAAARTGTADAKGLNKIKSELELVKLYLKLNMVEEAKSELEGFDALLSREDVTADRAISRTVLILRGRLQNALGNYQESAKIWEQLSDSNFKLERKIIKLDSARREMPPARLSTP